MITQRRHHRNYNIAGHAHALTFCCFQRFQFLRSDRTCKWLAASINSARETLDFDLWAYVFMHDHVHLIVRPRQPNYDIAQILMAIKHPTSKLALSWLRENRPDWLPRLTQRRGSKIESHFWQSGGGYDRNIVEGKTLIEIIDYIHLNPVRKGYVARPEEWFWSSARQYLEKCDSPLIVDPIPALCFDT